MKVLIACEESQIVCKAFRKLGHDAYSCDILPCSGGLPEWHIQGDAIAATRAEHWDLLIAHPPCTRLCNSGVRWLAERTAATGLERWVHPFQFLCEAVDERMKVGATMCD